MCDSWPPSASSAPSVPARADELVARVVAPHRPSERRLPEARARVALPLERAQRRSDEELEPDERRHGIAGKPEHERRVAHAERDRLAGLDRHAPEDLLDAELRGDAAHEVVRSNRHAARADDDVGLQRSRERIAMRVLVVAHRREPFDVGAVRAKRGLEHRPVRLVDLARLERLSRRAQLGAGREHRDARPARADDLRDAGGGKRADLRGSETRPGFEHDVAFARVASARPNVVTLANGDREPRRCRLLRQHARSGPPRRRLRARHRRSRCPSPRPGAARAARASRLRCAPPREADPACRRSAAAKPSIAELANGGRSTSARAGSASTRPAASPSATRSPGSGALRASTASIAASSVSRSVTWAP